MYNCTDAPRGDACDDAAKNAANGVVETYACGRDVARYVSTTNGVEPNVSVGLTDNVQLYRRTACGRWGRIIVGDANLNYFSRHEVSCCDL